MRISSLSPYQKITIIRVSRPSHKNLNDELQWFGTSLGLFSLRDKDKSCFRIFIELLKETRKKNALTSDQLAERLKLSRATVLHHLDKLFSAGIVVADRNRYYLRVETLSYLVDELKKDVDRMVDDLKDVASEIDRALGL